MSRLVPVESGTAVQVCTYGAPDGQSQCGQLAGYVVLLHDPRMDATVPSFRCYGHLGRGHDTVLARFPDAIIEIRRLPEPVIPERTCAHPEEDAPFGVIGCACAAVTP